VASLPDLEPYQGQCETGLPEGQDFDLYVLDGWLPPEGDLPDGVLLIVNPPGDSPLFGWPVPAWRPAIHASSPTIRRTLYLSFDNVNLLDFTVLDGVEWAEPLVWVDGGPLLLAGIYEGRQVAILTFDLHRSDLPLQIAWPILLANLMQWYPPTHTIDAPEGVRGGDAGPQPALRGRYAAHHPPGWADQHPPGRGRAADLRRYQPAGGVHRRCV
jgi:hypothetical protein